MIDRLARGIFGLTGRRSHGAWAVSAVAICLGCVVARGSVSAAELTCASRTLSGADEQRLRAAARTVLPKPAELSVLTPCKNPTWALGSIATRKVTTAEGVEQWWEFICRRETLPWTCDKPEFKQFIELSLELEGRSRKIELSFDAQTTLGGARVLAARALAIYADPNLRLPGCERGGHKDPGLLDLRRGHQLPSGTDAIHIGVSRAERADIVWLEDVSVDIEFNDETPCWNDMIIVA
jgi:hypothetical protein